MLKLFTTFICTIAITLVFFMSDTTQSLAHTTEPIPHIDLALSFDVEHALLRGTMKVQITPDYPLSFRLDGLRVTGAVLSSPGQENQLVTPLDPSLLVLQATPYEKTLLISYEKSVTSNFRDSISSDSIVLTSLWHPLPDRKSTFTLKAQVPPGFTAVSESDTFPETSPDGSALFSFSQPLFSLTFAAAPYVRESSAVRDGLLVHTLFFPENQHLAKDYLQSAVDYIKRYEKLIGTFPYNHYLIVENSNPTGFGLPTFTLLGSQVLRLPFIRETSLGHEILHSWFGNSISVRLDSGNWSEGLTTYLADMAYRHDQHEGGLARKEKILEYLSYVKPDTLPLKDFRFAGHATDTNRATRTVGYGRAASLFHELEIRLGEELFNETIRIFYERYRGTEASWQNIQELFEEVSSSDLSRFFTERLNSIDLPDLEVRDIHTHQKTDTTSLSFTIEQKSALPFEITLPFKINTTLGELDFSQLITEKTTKIAVEFDGHPLELIIDRNYDLMRTLSDKEYVPVWSQLMGNSKTTVILADHNEQSVYQPILDMASRYSWQVKGAGELDSDGAADGFLIFLGLSSPLSRSMYGIPAHPEEGFTLDIHSHPSKPQQPVALISSSSKTETNGAVSRLSHYGKYSYLHFNQGRISDKRSRPADQGLHFPITEEPGGIVLSQLSSFKNMIAQLNNYQVIYIGETHTSRADHLLQLMIIEALHQKNPDLAIGMEMFPRSSQHALDDYIQDSDVNEATFLRESRYYDVWSYDYRLFRPIFSYARKHKIDVIGLNIDRKIVSSVFKSNGLGNLAPEELSELPADRVLDMDGYAERLGETFSFHGTMEQNSGSFNGFIQAQAIWDETMAESIHNYLIEHPKAKMVVLAGSQHTRKDSGIPPRVERRMERSQASVLNLATSQLSADELSSVADYLFLLDVPDFLPQGKIGIVLQENTDEDIPGMKIIEVNPSSNAVQAGLQVNDILTHIENQPVTSMDDIRTTMLEKSAGENITVMVKRVDKKNTITDHTFIITLFNPDIKRTHP